MTTWTSLQAYAEILPYLPERRRQVLSALLDHNGSTAMELAQAMDQEVRNITPRLNELRTNYQAIHKGQTRMCRVTDHHAETWWCGPAENLALRIHWEVKESQLLQRWALLLQYAPDLAKNGGGPVIAKILGVREKKLYDELRKEKRRARNC